MEPGTLCVLGGRSPSELCPPPGQVFLFLQKHHWGFGKDRTASVDSLGQYCHLSNVKSPSP